MTSLGFGRLLYKWVLLYSRDLPCAARYCKRKAKAKPCPSDWNFIYSCIITLHSSKDRYNTPAFVFIYYNIFSFTMRKM
jgi:hypothetical protein